MRCELQTTLVGVGKRGGRLSGIDWCSERMRFGELKMSLVRGQAPIRVWSAGRDRV